MGRPAVVGNIAGRAAGILAVALVGAVAEGSIRVVWAAVHAQWAVLLVAKVAVLHNTQVEVVAPAESVAHTTQSVSSSPLRRPSFVRSTTPDHSVLVSTS